MEKCCWGLLEGSWELMEFDGGLFEFVGGFWRLLDGFLMVVGWGPLPSQRASLERVLLLGSGNDQQLLPSKSKRS